MILAVKVTLILLFAAYMKEMDLRYLLFKLKDETRLEKLLSSRDISNFEHMELMGYTRVKFKQCNKDDWITSIGGERKLEEVVKECNDRSECTGIYTQNCLSKGEKKILCKGEPEDVTMDNPIACIWIRKENCPVGELSINGKCKCGDSKSCFGNQKGPICDLDLNQCVCGEGVPKCQDNEYCIFGKCVVDGSWGKWEEWSKCQECRRGVMKRTRDCNVKGNGRQCVGKAEDFKPECRNDADCENNEICFKSDTTCYNEQDIPGYRYISDTYCQDQGISTETSLSSAVSACNANIGCYGFFNIFGIGNDYTLCSSSSTTPLYLLSPSVSNLWVKT